MNFESLMQQVLPIFPNATVGEDEDGQLVINTGLQIAGDGYDVIPMEES